MRAKSCARLLLFGLTALILLGGMVGVDRAHGQAPPKGNTRPRNSSPQGRPTILPPERRPINNELGAPAIFPGRPTFAAVARKPATEG